MQCNICDNVFTAKREKELRKQEMFKEMEEVKRQRKELCDRRKAQEKVLDEIFCQLIQQELKLEQEKVIDSRVGSSVI